MNFCEGHKSEQHWSVVWVTFFLNAFSETLYPSFALIFVQYRLKYPAETNIDCIKLHILLSTQIYLSDSIQLPKSMAHDFPWKPDIYRDNQEIPSHFI